MATAGHDDALSAFFSIRPGLFGIAYRMLGNAVEAEDIAQDVWLRWQSTNRSAVRADPRIFQRLYGIGHQREACALILRADGLGALATISASAKGIDQIMWFMRPSKLAATSSSPGSHLRISKTTPALARC